MIRYLYFIFSLWLLLCLSGCSQNTQDLSDTMKSAFIGPIDTNISPTKIYTIPYASMLTRLGDNPEALLILTWVEGKSSPHTLKWLSASKELIATKSGRVIKTVNLKAGNLISLRSSRPDPLSLNLTKANTPKEWHYQISWQPGYHSNYQAISKFMVKDIEEKEILTKAKSLLHVVEQVTIPALNSTYQNDYWLNPQNGHVEISKQYLFPGSKKIMLSIAKPYYGDQ
ncbi:YjbF family lipoprotein [Vibrio salinus]|uniref:YjbF family lipoprotein n=1 Tax=Vibrio salinus TaxID=2899784 RepID=UPI001E5237EF|nr:YjbF family lipoprotein [Vibrio salinus]MCE0493798.1 YjbF family lipoprotein [Vibrio salinus]